MEKYLRWEENLGKVPQKPEGGFWERGSQCCVPQRGPGEGVSAVTLDSAVSHSLTVLYTTQRQRQKAACDDLAHESELRKCTVNRVQKS